MAKIGNMKEETSRDDGITVGRAVLVFFFRNTGGEGRSNLRSAAPQSLLSH